MKIAIVSYFIIAVTLLISSFFVTGALDIATHDTYWVIASSHVFLFGAFLFFLFGVITLALHRLKHRSSPWLVWIHLVLSILFPIFISVVPSYSPSKTFNNYSVYDEVETVPSFDWNSLIVILGVLFVIAQFLFVVNLVRAIFLKREHN
jgi:heme/copper-type cytochrome/quinol oxidase subunit 1